MKVMFTPDASQDEQVSKLSDIPSATAPESPADMDERNRRIAEAAYYRAEARGFAAGSELEDWLMAEAEFDGLPPSEPDSYYESDLS